MKSHKSEVDMWTVTEKCAAMIAGTSMSLVCGRNWWRRRMTEYQDADCSAWWIQQLEINVLHPLFNCTLEILELNSLTHLVGTTYTEQNMGTSDGDIERHFWKLRRNDFVQVEFPFFEEVNVPTAAACVPKRNELVRVESVQRLNRHHHRYSVHIYTFNNSFHGYAIYGQLRVKGPQAIWPGDHLSVSGQLINWQNLYSNPYKVHTEVLSDEKLTLKIQ